MIDICPKTGELRLSFFLISVLFSSLSWAAKWKELPEGDLTTKFGFTQSELQLNVQPQTGSASKLEYHPAPSNLSYISMGYANFGLSASAKNPNTAIDDTKYGTSQARDFQFRFFGKKLIHEFFYQTYRGYYLKNSSDVVANFDNSGPYLQQSDMVTEAGGLNLMYNFNPDNYNMGATFNQSARQVESGGAWVGIFSLNRHRFTNSGSFVLGSAVGQYPDFESVRSVNVYSASVGGGGAYTLTYANYYLGTMLTMSYCAEKAYIESAGTNKNSESSLSNMRFHLKLGLGYNGETFLAGFRYNLDNNNFDFANTQVGLNTNEVQLHVGCRFHEMGWTWVDHLSEAIFN
jgi:hypothetical protein